MSALEDVVGTLNGLPEVEWDRCTRGGGELTVFGWIGRDDGRSDFVVMVFDEDGLSWFTTSSALLSSEFSRRLLGEDAPHMPCERVEDVFGDLVRRKVVLRGR